MFKNEDLILEKAKKTEYKHPKWFKDSGKSVYEVADYFVKMCDFYVDLVSTLTSVSMIPNYSGNPYCCDKKEIISYCLKNELYEYLVIRRKHGKGTDTGKLKIQTFLILKAEFNSREAWTRDEINTLRLYYSKGIEDVQFRLLGRSTAAIKTKAQSLGLKPIVSKPYSVTLKSCGDVDYGQNPDKPIPGVKNSVYTAESIPELQKAVRNYIDMHDLGGGSFDGGEVFFEGKQIGRISYNGRYWENDEVKLEYPV